MSTFPTKPSLGVLLRGWVHSAIHRWGGSEDRSTHPPTYSAHQASMRSFCRHSMASRKIRDITITISHMDEGEDLNGRLHTQSVFQ